MEACQYEPIEKDDRCEFENVSWTPFLRQTVVCSGVMGSFFVFGLSMGAPTVIIPQIRKDANFTEAVSDEMAGWLSSVFGYAALPWLVIIPLLSEYIGRKYPFLIINICTLGSYILFYYSTTVMQLLTSEIMQGVLAAGNITIGILIVTEYTAPRYRGLFMTMKSSTLNWGIWASNTVGTFFHWKTIAFGAFACIIFNLVTVIFWPESPYWLASKGCFEECAESHRWLNGNSKHAEKELNNLINFQKVHLNNYVKAKSTTLRENISRYLKIVSSRKFYQPILICMTVINLYHFCGKFALTIYAIDVIKKISGTDAAAYTGMLILDGVTILGMYAASVLSRYMKRRTQLLSFSSVGIVFLFLTSLYLYLTKLSYVFEDKYVSIFLLMAFSMTISCGPIIMSTSIYGELVPLRFRSASVIVIGIYFDTMLATILKVSPYIFKTFELHGAFLFYGVTSSVWTALLYLYMPETKDKTLQEIDESMSNTSRKEIRKLVY